MNKLLTLAAAGAIAVFATLPAATPSQAFSPPPPAFAAGVAGFIVGATLASAAAHDHYYGDHFYGESWDDHVEACYSAYRTYDEADDRYTAGFDSYGDPIRVRCKL